MTTFKDLFENYQHGVQGSVNDELANGSQHHEVFSKLGLTKGKSSMRRGQYDDLITHRYKIPKNADHSAIRDGIHSHLTSKGFVNEHPDYIDHSNYEDGKGWTHGKGESGNEESVEMFGNHVYHRINREF